VRDTVTDSTDNKHCREQKVGDIDPRSKAWYLARKKWCHRKEIIE
jgi:hypothetical protein